MKTYAELVAADRDECYVRAAEVESMAKSLVAIPPLSFVVEKNAKMKMCGLGEVQAGGEVSKLLPRTMARLQHPRFV